MFSSVCELFLSIVNSLPDTPVWQVCLGARCVSVTVVAAEVLSHENKTRYGFNFTEALTAFSPHNVTRVKRFPHSKMRGLREGKVSVDGVLLQLSVLLCLGE